MLQLAQRSDREAVELLAHQVHERHVSWRPDLYEMPDELYPVERFDAETVARRLYVAKLDNKVVGYAAVQIRTVEGLGRIKRRIMLIEEICVDELFRRHGYGTQIVTDLSVLAKAFGCTELQISVFPQNDEAVNFYQKMGFFISSIAMQRKL